MFLYLLIALLFLCNIYVIQSALIQSAFLRLKDNISLSALGKGHQIQLQLAVLAKPVCLTWNLISNPTRTLMLKFSLHKGSVRRPQEVFYFENKG